MATLKVDSVQLAFDLRKVLQDVYIECQQGEIVGLLGRNGSGKSSLLKIIFGTLTPGYKYVSIDDEFIRKGCLNNKIAYLPQHNYLPRGISIKKLATAIVSEQYWDEFSNHTIYRNHQHKKPEQLSGGELRQLEMLMILYSRANFILLDEPFTHVTPVQSEYFKTVIKTVGETKGIIITDHQYQNVLDVSNRIILLNEGSTKPITHVDELPFIATLVVDNMNVVELMQRVCHDLRIKFDVSDLQDWGIINSDANRVEEFIDYFNVLTNQYEQYFVFELITSSYNDALLQGLTDEKLAIKFSNAVKASEKNKNLNIIKEYWIKICDNDHPVSKFL